MINEKWTSWRAFDQILRWFIEFVHKIAGLSCIFPLSFSTFCLEMTLSNGAKIFAAVIAAIIFIELLVIILMLATHEHDDDNPGTYVQPLNIILKLKMSYYHRKSWKFDSWLETFVISKTQYSHFRTLALLKNTNKW